jgi:hypothetical protein
MTAKFVRVTADDWEALYVDGVRVWQYHRLDPNELAEQAGLDYVHLTCFEHYVDMNGEFPSDLSTLLAWQIAAM